MRKSRSRAAASRLIGQTYTGPSGGLGDLTYQYAASGNRIGTRIPDVLRDVAQKM
jgi:hypothetical protein